MIGDNDGADLFVGQEFDTGVGEDPKQCRRVTSVQAHPALVSVDVLHGAHDAEPGTGVFGELRIAGLEEDFDSVERRNQGFGLDSMSVCAHCPEAWVQNNSQQILLGRQRRPTSIHSSKCESCCARRSWRWWRSRPLETLRTAWCHRRHHAAAACCQARAPSWEHGSWAAQRASPVTAPALLADSSGGGRESTVPTFRGSVWGVVRGATGRPGAVRCSRVNATDR